MAEKISVLGAGSWGMAVTQLLAGNGHKVTLWEFDPGEFDKLNRFRTISSKLKDFRLPDSVGITNDLKAAVADAGLIVLAVPAQSLRSVLKTLGRFPTGVGVVNLAKGVETGTLKRMSEVIESELKLPPDKIATLSGPSHAEEVIRDLPTTVVVAGRPEAFVVSLQEIFSGQFFRVYFCGDLIGVELGGALKNIIAIASGIADGLGMGDNTRGALITRGLAEITRLGLAMGAQSQTFAGLSGIGDLVTTCSSRHSRNRYVGERLGLGEKLADILGSMSMVAEGVETTKSGYELARNFGVEMPITTEVYRVLFEDKPARQAVEELMGRELKAEVWR
jgi:glycerol-3-phosphate dehydrogenase (NAD(P)+)